MSTNKNRIIGGFEDSFEKGKANLSDSTKKTTNDFVKTTKSQLVGGENSNSVGDGTEPNAIDQGAGRKASDQGTNEVAVASANNQNNNSDQKSDEERIKFLRDLYGSEASSSSNLKNEKKDNDKKNNSSDIRQALGFSEKDPHAGMSPEEAARYEAAKRQLHGDYYQEFLDKSKSKDPSVKEKLEQEEQEEKMKEFEMQQKKEKRKLPVSVKQGTAETAMGTVG